MSELHSQEWTEKLNALDIELDMLRVSATDSLNAVEDLIAEKLKIVTDKELWDQAGLISDEVFRECDVLTTAIAACKDQTEVDDLRRNYCQTEFGRRVWLNVEEGHRWEAYETKLLLTLIDAASAFGIGSYEATRMARTKGGQYTLADLIRAWEMFPELQPAKKAA